jgi:hypothetical protein
MKYYLLVGNDFFGFPIPSELYGDLVN